MAAQGTRPSERGVRLFLGNLAYDATESHISQALQGCGGVQYVGIGRAPDTQKSRGYGQVEFASKEDALRAFERLQGLEIKGRNLRIDWAEQPLRRKHPITTMGPGGPQRDVTAQGNLPTVELFDADGCLTAAALSAAEGVTLGDVEQILDELRLLLPSTGSLLQQLLQESPLLRAALLQAQLLLGRHENIDFSGVSATALKRAEAAATQRLLLECRALRPPPLPDLTITPPPQTTLKPLTSATSSRQRRQEAMRPVAAWRPSAPSRGPVSPDTRTVVNGPPGGPSWRASPPPDSQVGGGGTLSLSPLTPEPSATAYGDRAEGKGEAGSSSTAIAPQKRRREGEDQHQSTNNAEGTSGGGKRTLLAPGATTSVGRSTDGHAEWLATEEAKAAPAPDSLVDELLRSQGLAKKVIEMTATELMQLDQQNRQQILSLRKALRARGKLSANGA